MVYSINEIVKYLQVIYYGLVINNINLKCKQRTSITGNAL